MKLARLSLTALFLGAIACSSVQAVHSPQQFFETQRPNVVMVVYNDGGEVPVADPKMRGDTIVGTWYGLGEPVEVPMNEVQWIGAMQKDPRKTTLFVAALVGAAAVTTYGLTRAIQNHGEICDYARFAGAPPGSSPLDDNGGCYRSSASN